MKTFMIICPKCLGVRPATHANIRITEAQGQVSVTLICPDCNHTGSV